MARACTKEIRAVEKMVKDSRIPRPVLPNLQDRYTSEEIEECIYKHQGIRTTICNELDCTYKQFTDYLMTHQEMKLHVEKAREKIVDIAEDILMKALQSDDEKVRLDAAKYVTKTLGRSRGYVESPNVICQTINIGDERKQINAIFGLPDREEIDAKGVDILTPYDLKEIPSTSILSKMKKSTDDEMKEIDELLKDCEEK